MVDLGVVVRRGVNGAPSWQADVTIFCDVALAFMRYAQARAQTDDVRIPIFSHATQDVLRHIDRALAVEVGLDGGVFAFGI